MNTSKFRIFFKLYWLRILIITILSVLGISLIFALIASIKSWVNMESFYKEQMKASIGFQLYLTLITALLWGAIYTHMWYWMMFKGGGFREFSKLQTKAVKGEDIGIKWQDVIGMEEAKREAWEAVELIRERSRVKTMGGQIIKGILLIGPPGVGKTYLAKAIATECDMPFLSVVGSELEGIIVGLGAQKIRKLFKSARDMAALKGGCVIFIDEVDSVARPRSRTFGFGGGESYNMAVNQLLAEMDGLRQKDLNIVIIAATNVTEEDLDSALMRAGRFDRKIYIGLPSLKDRESLFKYYLNKVAYSRSEVKIDRLARLSVGNSPADIANMVKEGSLIAARKKAPLITMSELEEAREKISLGIKLNIKMSDKDKNIAAYHEAGHVIVTYLLVPTKDVFKASIVPRRTSGGSTWMVKKEESYIPDKEDLLSEIKILLSGYAAEKIKFGITSSGVHDDLRRANEIADKMVSIWGMGTSGATAVSDINKWSPTQSQIAAKDKDEIITKCFNEVHELLRKELPILEKMAQDLLQKEDLDYDAIENIFSEFGKTRLMEKKESKEEKAIGWDDVIGMEEAKEEATEIVKLIKDRAQLNRIGGRIIRGLLMFGPPGCGKTYLASAMANEASLPFLVKTGSEFVEMYVGVGASRIRHLFQEARELALSKGGCIIFIDEIDALGGKRGETNSGGAQEYNQTLNQLLAEMDGLKEKDDQYNIVVIGATNMKEEFMDPALLRAGRFDRKIYVDLPGLEERTKLFDYYLKKVKYNPDEINSHKLAGVTSGWSPADIANLTREGALITIRNKKEVMGIKEIEEARERIELGLKRRIKLSPEENKATAYHEAGHAIAGHFFAPWIEQYKLSIIPRKRTLGVSWANLKGETESLNKNQILGLIKRSLGGYVAEKLKCPSTTNGVTIDFEHALKNAYSMVWAYGMGASGYIGNFYSLMEKTQQSIISEEMKAKLDKDVQEIMHQCLKETEELFKKHDALLETLAKKLLEKEELNYDEIATIFKECSK